MSATKRLRRRARRAWRRNQAAKRHQQRATVPPRRVKNPDGTHYDVDSFGTWRRLVLVQVEGGRMVWRQRVRDGRSARQRRKARRAERGGAR